MSATWSSTVNGSYSAEMWMTALFFAVSKENRPRAYKQLAALFHPDQGGDERLMIALNNVRARLR
jgi:hypothetical protein